jgi:hypothetical protein
LFETYVMMKILLSMVNILCEVPLYNFLVVRIRKRFFTWSVATHGHYTSFILIVEIRINQHIGFAFPLYLKKP